MKLDIGDAENGGDNLSVIYGPFFMSLMGLETYLLGKFHAHRIYTFVNIFQISSIRHKHTYISRRLQ